MIVLLPDLQNTPTSFHLLRGAVLFFKREPISRVQDKATELGGRYGKRSFTVRSNPARFAFCVPALNRLRSSTHFRTATSEKSIRVLSFVANTPRREIPP